MQNFEEYIDQNAALNRIRGNKTLYKRLLLSFFGDSLMDTLAEEVGREDIQAAAKSAHAIKGASANLSLTKLNEAVKLLESSLKSGVCDKSALTECLVVFEETKKAVNDILNSDEYTKDLT